MVETVYLIVKLKDQSQDEAVTLVPFQHRSIDAF